MLVLMKVQLLTFEIEDQQRNGTCKVNHTIHHSICHSPLYHQIYQFLIEWIQVLTESTEDIKVSCHAKASTGASLADPLFAKRHEMDDPLKSIEISRDSTPTTSSASIDLHHPTPPPTWYYSHCAACFRSSLAPQNKIDNPQTEACSAHHQNLLSQRKGKSDGLSCWGWQAKHGTPCAWWQWPGWWYAHGWGGIIASFIENQWTPVSERIFHTTDFLVQVPLYPSAFNRPVQPCHCCVISNQPRLTHALITHNNALILTCLPHFLPLRQTDVTNLTWVNQACRRLYIFTDDAPAIMPSPTPMATPNQLGLPAPRALWGAGPAAQVPCFVNYCGCEQYTQVCQHESRLLLREVTWSCVIHMWVTLSLTPITFQPSAWGCYNVCTDSPVPPWRCKNVETSPFIVRTEHKARNEGIKMKSRGHRLEDEIAQRILKWWQVGKWSFFYFICSNSMNHTR